MMTATGSAISWADVAREKPWQQIETMSYYIIFYDLILYYVLSDCTYYLVLCYIILYSIILDYAILY